MPLTVREHVEVRAVPPAARRDGVGLVERARRRIRARRADIIQGCEELPPGRSRGDERHAVLHAAVVVPRERVPVAVVVDPRDAQQRMEAAGGSRRIAAEPGGGGRRHVGASGAGAPSPQATGAGHARHRLRRPSSSPTKPEIVDARQVARDDAGAGASCTRTPPPCGGGADGSLVGELTVEDLELLLS
jgi:hypothetical protein